MHFFGRKTYNTFKVYLSANFVKAQLLLTFTLLRADRVKYSILTQIF